MKQSYLSIIQAESNNEIISTIDWEQWNRDADYFNFYKRVMAYVFLDEDADYWKRTTNTVLYSLFFDICGTMDYKLQFITLFQNFLSSIDDDTYFSISWKRFAMKGKYAVDFDETELCVREDSRAFPAIVLDNEEGTQDVQLLNDTLDFIESKEFESYKKLKEAGVISE